MLWGTVASLQDHGCVVDIGMDGAKVFVATKEMEAYTAVHILLRSFLCLQLARGVSAKYADAR